VSMLASPTGFEPLAPAATGRRSCVFWHVRKPRYNQILNARINIGSLHREFEC
jgi:hypothetical protein